MGGCGASTPGGNTATPAPSPVPLVVSSITPKEIPTGSGAVTVTVTGTGFTSQSVIVLDGVDEPTTYMSGTQLQAMVPAAQLQSGKILGLAVRNGSTVAQAATTTVLQVDNPTPTITSFAPATALLGTTGATVTITGTSYVAGVAATVNGNPRATSLVSDTQVTVALGATDLAQAGSLLLNVTNPQPGGGASGTAAFTVNNPLPTIRSLAPAGVQVGGAATTIAVSGSGFVPGTGVLVNGASRTTTYVSGTSLTVSLSAADQSGPGTLTLTAVNSSPGGGVSASSALSVNNPVPGAITITPNTPLAGAAGPTLLNVAGSGLVSSTMIQVNGVTRPSTYVSPTQMIATISAADGATAGVLQISAMNASPGGGTSPNAALTINHPAPGAILVSPNVVSTGTSQPTSMTVTGAHFVPSTVIQVNGSVRPKTFVSSTELISALTVADQASGGSLVIAAVTPAPGGGTSNTASIAVNNPTLGVLNFSPDTVPVGTSHDTVITVTGSEFIPGTSIQVNGAARATTYGAPTQLSFVCWRETPPLRGI